MIMGGVSIFCMCGFTSLSYTNQESMKTKYLIIFLISVALFVSCSDKNGNVINVDVDEVSLEGQLVKIDVNEEKWPTWLLGDNIFARDYDFNLFCGKLTKTEWQTAEKVFTCGHGHNEFGLMALSQDKEGALYVIDRPIQGTKLISLTKIQNTDSIAAVKNQTKWEKYNLRQLPPFRMNGDDFLVMSDSTILVIGAPADDMHHVLAIINFKNQTVTPLDYWPEDGTPESLTEEKMISYTYGGGVHSNGKDRYLFWDDSAKHAFIFTIDGKKTNVLSSIYSDFIPMQGDPSIERIHCCADNEKIYLLYRNSNSKGIKMEKYNKKEPFPMGNTVEVYDWDGVKQQVIHLDRFGKVIMLSEDSNTLYLYSEEMSDGSDPYIYSYDLSSLKKYAK